MSVHLNLSSIDLFINDLILNSSKVLRLPDTTHTIPQSNIHFLQTFCVQVEWAAYDQSKAVRSRKENCWPSKSPYLRGNKSYQNDVRILGNMD